MLKIKLDMYHVGLFAVVVLFVGITIYGCSTITVPNPEEVMKHPLGTESIKIGMTKQRV